MGDLLGGLKGMTPSETVILATYFFVLVILAVYGWHRYYLVYLYMLRRISRWSGVETPSATTSTPM